MTYKTYIKESLKSWDLVIPILLKGLPKDLFVIDVGCNYGGALIKVRKLLPKATLIGVDPSWQYDRQYLRKIGYGNKYFKKKRIEIIPEDALALDLVDIPYNQADLIIKTYNPFVSWDKILKIHMPKYIITCPYHKSKILKSKYKKVKTVTSLNSYILFKKISR